MPGKAQGLSNINPTLVAITFPSDDPSSSSRSVLGCPTKSHGSSMISEVTMVLGSKPFPGFVTLESKWFAFSGPQFPHV